MYPKYVHLRTHSDYSVINSILKINRIVAAAKEANMPAVALTDVMNLCASVKFYKACRAAGIKPIIGSDVYFSSHFDNSISPLTILVKNDTGLGNLRFLLTTAYQRGYENEKPFITQQDLSKNREGLIILSGGVDGVIGSSLISKNKARLDYYLDFFISNFNDNFYLEISKTNKENEDHYLSVISDIAVQHDLPLVATNLALMEKESQFNVHEIRVSINSGHTILDKSRPQEYTSSCYFRSADEMSDLFINYPEAIENSVEIAKRCNLSLSFGEYFLPKFPTGKLSEGDFLAEAARAGLNDKLQFLFPDPAIRQTKKSIYFDRLEDEIRIINNMGFPGYFLIVMEFIQWSKVQDIPVGPGRGSGAGSLVAYSLDITNLDPIEFDLLFERFLNPERVSMPDFDIDFCMDRRDEVIAHTADVYGRDAVAQIITFGTMSAKSVIRDVGRVLGHSYNFVDRISKLVPNDLGITISQALKQESSFDEAYREDEQVQELIDISLELEGLIRNIGKHAGGVVISPTVISDFAALHCDPSGKNPVTQLDKGDVEEIGLVKFDFLGLRTLTIIHSAIVSINKSLALKNEKPIDIAHISLSDPKVFEVLSKGDTTAVFQLESSGMKDLIKRLIPDCFEDIIALVALFRPGPLQSGMVDNFIDRKRGKEDIFYPDKNYQHESLKDILTPTYGIILYQEQVMQIAQTLAGYTLGDADLLRRAMGKKKPEEMANQRSLFKNGAIKNGVDGELAMRIFDLVEKFAGYGFNKSHSAAYALLSYQTLWLKVNYPSYFLAAVLSSDMDNTDKVVHFLDECKRMNVNIIYPDINKSEYDFFAADDSTIVYGLGAIKGVGLAATENIISCRKQGEFKDLFDFCQRVDLQKINKRVLEKLVFSGAFSSFNVSKSVLFKSLSKATSLASHIIAEKEKGQASLFDVGFGGGNYDTSYVDSEPLHKKDVLIHEYETLGFYLTDHPMSCYQKQLQSLNITQFKDLEAGNKSYTISGLLSSFRVKYAKSGKRIAILYLCDKNSSVDVLLYEEQCNEYRKILKKNNVYIINVNVKLDRFSGGIKIIGTSMTSIEDYRIDNARSLSLDLTAEDINEDKMGAIHDGFENNKGGCEVFLKYYCNDVYCNISTFYKVALSDSLMELLENSLGEECLFVDYK